MIRSLGSFNLIHFDYEITKIYKYTEAYSSKILIIDDDSYDLVKLKELLVNNPKIKLIMLTQQDPLKFYELGIDFVVNEKKLINAIIHNLDTRHNVISRVEIKEDFNKVRIGNQLVRLTPKEMAIFKYLENNRGELCTRKRMLVDILGYHEDADSRVIDVYVKHIRTKLKEEGFKIETIRGKGYIYNN